MSRINMLNYFVLPPIRVRTILLFIRYYNVPTRLSQPRPVGGGGFSSRRIFKSQRSHTLRIIYNGYYIIILLSSWRHFARVICDRHHIHWQKSSTHMPRTKDPRPTIKCDFLHQVQLIVVLAHWPITSRNDLRHRPRSAHPVLPPSHCSSHGPVRLSWCCLRLGETQLAAAAATCASVLAVPRHEHRRDFFAGIAAAAAAAITGWLSHRGCICCLLQSLISKSYRLSSEFASSIASTTAQTRICQFII